MHLLGQGPVIELSRLAALAHRLGTLFKHQVSDKRQQQRDEIVQAAVAKQCRHQGALTDLAMQQGQEHGFEYASPAGIWATTPATQLIRKMPRIEG